MNLLYISAARIPSRAANSVHVMKMCQAFASLGIKTYLVSARKNDELEIGVNDPFKYYGAENSFSLIRLPWLTIKGFAGLYSIQIVFVFLFLSLRHLQRPLCYSRFPLGLYLLRVFRPNMTLEIHAPIPKSGIQSYIMRKILTDKKLLRLIVISKALEAIVLEDSPELSQKIMVAHDGADAVDHSERFPVTKQLSASLDIGYVGHLYKGRGINTMIEIAKHLPTVHLHLAGGLEKDISYWKAETTDIKNITFYGFLAPSDTVAFRNSVDVLLAPYERKVSVYSSSMDTSRWMSPLKIFEYMAAKKPIICSDLPVLREILQNDHNALLCNPESPEEWVHAVERTMTDAVLAKRLASQAHDDFIKKYTWRTRAKKVLQ